MPEASRSAIVPVGRWNTPEAAELLKLLRLVQSAHSRGPIERVIMTLFRPLKRGCIRVIVSLYNKLAPVQLFIVLLIINTLRT